MKTHTTFTRELIEFLIRMEYSHIYLFGTTDSPDDSSLSEYLLIPLKAIDPRLFYEEADMIINEIKSPEVIEMGYKIPFINFVLEMPLSDFISYKNFNPGIDC